MRVSLTTWSLAVSGLSLIQAGSVSFSTPQEAVQPSILHPEHSDDALNFPTYATMKRAASGNFISIFSGKDMEYTVQLIVGSTQVSLLLDTGSSDLWIDNGAVASQTSTGTVSVEYTNGKLVQGTVRTLASAGLAGFTVATQPYISTSTPCFLREARGVLGLGPRTGSVLLSKFTGNAQYNPLMDKIFSQTPTSQPFITFFFPRTGTGRLAIMNTQLQSLFTKSPRVPVVQATDKFSQKWSTRIGGFQFPEGVIGQNSLVAYDTGSTFSWVPASVAARIYKDSNAVYNSTFNLYVVPCAQQVTVEILIGNQQYFMHPLDTTIDVGRACIGTFRPILPGHNVDIILGMPFFRSFYTLINYGSFTSTSITTAPFMQFLQLKSTATAAQEFSSMRGKPGDIVASTVLSQSNFEFYELPPDLQRRLLAVPHTQSGLATTAQTTAAQAAECAATFVPPVSGVQQNDKLGGELVEEGSPKTNSSAAVNNGTSSTPSPVVLDLLIAILAVIVFFGSAILLCIYWQLRRRSGGSRASSYRQIYDPNSAPGMSETRPRV
ncbi:hypothetical protein M422DRAFT_250541 [Sphaerobolus stellatus SS14]|uniref:Peptidase A1 domain-containing protein n=1 Tax=Sphaerobolus stellatus (strain SS14) TaxID=990650 RepID=A0A0C9W309_SPHS4|nr:hypothetical protein M422DRAFT_250541 [Sphaerobolus stellatus SS14]